MSEHWLEGLRNDAANAFGGWVNETSGRGDPERDKIMASVWTHGAALQVFLLRSLFEKNALARAICTSLPEWGTRNGYDLTIPGDAVGARKTETDIRRTMADIGAGDAVLKASTWGQAFGGGLILIGAEDGKRPNQPLDLTKLKSVKFLRAISRDCVDVTKVYGDPIAASFGEPAEYRVRESPLYGQQLETLWHESRVISFPGMLTEDETKRSNESWDLSVLDTVIRDLLKHDTMWDDTGGMMADGSQGVWKIQGLAKAVQSGLESAIRSRFKLAEQSRSMFRSLLLDADREDFQYVHRQFAGISELLAQSVIRTAGAAQIPAIVLMGQSPAGMGADGAHNLELWYARCSSYQTRVLQPRLRRLIGIVLASKEGPTGGVVPESWSVEMADPRSLTPMQKAELRARQSQVDGAAMAAGVLRPEEVAVNRYSAEGWSDATVVDLGWRRERLADDDALGEWLAREPVAMQSSEGGDKTALPQPPDGAGESTAQTPFTGGVE